MYISDVDLLARIEEDQSKFVKVKERECPVDKKLTLHDIKMIPRAKKEDEAFSQNPFLLKNVRRGNTIIKGAS